MAALAAASPSVVAVLLPFQKFYGLNCKWNARIMQ